MAQEATRAPFGLRYDLIPAKALKRWAKRHFFAGEKYGDPVNFRKGLPGDKDPINHAIGHLYDYLDERRQMRRGERTEFSDDHLGAALCNIGIEVDLEDLGHCYDPDGRLRPDYMYLDGEPVQLGLFASDDEAIPNPEPQPEPKTNILDSIKDKILGRG